MDKKKRQKSNSKRAQKEAARGKARKRVNSQTKHFYQMQQIAIKRAQRQPQIEYYSESSDVKLPDCHGVGECCLGFPVIVDPSDFQRILYNSRVREVFGIEFTMDLFGNEKSRGVLSYGLDPRSGVPMCSIRRDTKEEGKEYCVFLEVDDTGDGMCMLGDDRPTMCRAKPIRRLAKKNKFGQMDGFHYAVMEPVCRRCHVCDDKRHIVTVAQWLEFNKMKERFADTDLFHGLCGWLSKNVKAEEHRQLAAMMLFDFDRFSIDIGKMSKEDAVKPENRPDSGATAMVAARKLIESTMGAPEGEEN